MADAQDQVPESPAPGEIAAVVTGGGGGLGLAVGGALQRAGYRVALIVRDEDAAAEGAAHYEEPPAIVVADVTDRVAMEAAVAEIAFGIAPPLVLVNAAGIAESAGTLPPDDELWARTLEVNATGTWIASTACLPHMRTAGYGFVCNVASTAALEGYRYTAAYVASKHAVLGLTRALRADFEGTGIGITSVCPGFLDTPMTDRTVANMVEKTGMAAGQARAAIAKMNRSGRLITPDEVADVVLKQLAAGAPDETVRLD
jgi:NAD(P)-dependent dehydrogenase (short-subunit alcohol dehydrogenase family)